MIKFRRESSFDCQHGLHDYASRSFTEAGFHDLQILIIDITMRKGVVNIGLDDWAGKRGRRWCSRTTCGPIHRLGTVARCHHGGPSRKAVPILLFQVQASALRKTAKLVGYVGPAGIRSSPDQAAGSIFLTSVNAWLSVIASVPPLSFSSFFVGKDWSFTS